MHGGRGSHYLLLGLALEVGGACARWAGPYRGRGLHTAPEKGWVGVEEMGGAYRSVGGANLIVGGGYIMGVARAFKPCLRKGWGWRGWAGPVWAGLIVTWAGLIALWAWPELTSSAWRRAGLGCAGLIALWAGLTSWAWPGL